VLDLQRFQVHLDFTFSKPCASLKTSCSVLV